jgi:hypothetical protein
MSNNNLNFNFNNSILESKRQKLNKNKNKNKNNDNDIDNEIDKDKYNNNIIIENNTFINSLLNKDTSHQKIKNILDCNYNERKKKIKLTNALISDKNVQKIKQNNKNQYNLYKNSPEKKFKFISEINFNTPNKSPQVDVDIIELSKSYMKSKNFLFSKIKLLDLKRKSIFPFTRKNHNFDINEENNNVENEINFEEYDEICLSNNNYNDIENYNYNLKIEPISLLHSNSSKDNSNSNIDSNLDNNFDNNYNNKIEISRTEENTEGDENIRKIKSININQEFYILGK